MTSGGRVLFTSIPKCGKNLIYSFMGALGWIPAPISAEVGAASYASDESGVLPRASYGYPAPDAAATPAEAANTVRAELAAAPPGTVVHGHLAYSPALVAAARAEGASVVFVYRDPADAVLSAAAYARYRHLPPHIWNRLGHLDFDELLIALIGGHDNVLSLAEMYAAFQGWRHEPDVLALRFEDLVGTQGGGSATAQQATLESLTRHIGWYGSQDELRSAIERTFNPAAGTFFRGQIGRAGRSPSRSSDQHS